MLAGIVLAKLSQLVNLFNEKSKSSANAEKVY
jgi:hypothetical protein